MTPEEMAIKEGLEWAESRISLDYIRGLLSIPEDQARMIIMDMVAAGYVSAKAEMRWIPCSERLPTIGTKVLAKHKAEGVLLCALKKLKCGDKVFITDNCLHDLSGFTHWMPLPTPPEGI